MQHIAYSGLHDRKVYRADTSWVRTESYVVSDDNEPAIALTQFFLYTAGLRIGARDSLVHTLTLPDS